MATKSVATTDTVSQPAHIYSEPDPFERALARLSGISAIQVVVDCAMESDAQPTNKVWENLWFFVATVMDDVKRDMFEMLQSQRGETP